MGENVYFNRILEGHPTSSTHNHIDWHPVHPLLAVASKQSTNAECYVTVYNEKGILIYKASIPKDEAGISINRICWHPHRKHLSVALDDGEVYYWNDNDKSFTLAPTQHASIINILQWSSCGSKLITADQRGVVVAWRLGQSNQLEMVFHHELNDSFTTLAFKTSNTANDVDIGGLAKAAVNGDEGALDFFNSYHTKLNRSVSITTEIEFYIGSQTGALYFVRENGSCIEVVSVNSPIQRLLYHQTRNILIAINESPAIMQYTVQPDGILEEISRVKLAGGKFELDAVWAGKGILALTFGERSIRIMDIDNGHNYSLPLDDADSYGAEHVTNLSYLERKTAGTNLGNVQMWVFVCSTQLNSCNDPENQWQRTTKCSLKGAIRHLLWNTSSDSMAVNTTNNIHLLTPIEKSYCLNKQLFAVQFAADRLAIESLNLKKPMVLQSDIEIRGIYLTLENVVIWNGQKLAIYEISLDTRQSRVIACFPTETNAVVIHEQSIYIVEGRKIQVRTFQGTVKQTIGFLETEGEITSLDLSGFYLAAATTVGCLKIWELSRREARPFSTPKLLTDEVSRYGCISSMRVNCKGNKVSILFSKDNKLLVWDCETDAFLTRNFKKDLGLNELEVSAEKNVKLLINPKSIYWEPNEPRILAIEISIHSQNNLNKTWILSMFVTSDNGILTQDVISIETILYSHLVGVQVPNFYLLKKDMPSIVGDRILPLSPKDTLPQLVKPITMKDFVGLDDKDVSTRDAIMNFSFNLSVGNMDEAFKAIKKIKSVKIWENMARMCVKSKRLDVALVCLGHMGNANTAKALRESAADMEPDIQVALLATHLGMLDEAEKLYKSHEKYDLLNKFYQASGQWEKALDVAVAHDRIHLKSTYYNYAKYLEAKGDLSAAITNYENSQTHHFEVPRMLLEDPSSLENYVLKSHDKKLFKWWAQYLESAGEMETALQFYEKANDILSLVRVYCYCNNLDKAAEIADSSDGATDRAACYHVGQQYENRGDIKQAVHFFTKAHAYNNAIRICKEQGMDDQLLNLALMGGKNELIDVARYYEFKTIYTDRAVMLYHKGGLVGKAVELAFKSNQRSALEQLAYDIDERSDPQILQRCAAFFLETGQPDKAVDLLVKTKDYLAAISLCLERKVTMTEQLVEKLSPPKDMEDVKLRNELLERIAECCYQQDNYHLATKKFTQAGNKIKAMKALLKSGDTERIIFFANVSRQTEIYIMAANYLQTLDWRKHPEIMKHIIGFYTKGKALDLLAVFFEACAEAEIDEFQNYEKALGALHEAYKNISAITERNRNSTHTEKLERLRGKLEIVKKFVNIRAIYEDNSVEAMRLCHALLKEENLHLGVRIGDVYGFMVEHYSKDKNYKQAFSLIGEMKAKLPNVNLAFYIDQTTLNNIYRGMDIPYPNSSALIIDEIKKNSLLDNGDEVKEELYTV